jgi:hypothetical protein
MHRPIGQLARAAEVLDRIEAETVLAWVRDVAS